MAQPEGNNSQSPTTAELREQLRGKWQIPLMALSVVALVGALLLVVRTREPEITPADLLARAEAALQGGNHADAAAATKQYLETFPAGDHLARIQEVQGDANYALGLRSFEDQHQYFKRAEAAYRAANELRAGGVASPSILLKLGRTHLQIDEPQLALNCYDRALDSAPQDPYEIQMARIEALRRMDEFDGALATARAAQQIEGLSSTRLAAAVRTEARILNEIGRYADAEKTLREALDRTAGVAASKRYLMDLADTQRRAEQYTRAIDTLYELLDTEAPGDPSAERIDGQAFYLMGRVNYEMTNYGDALHWFERTFTEYPEASFALPARLGTAETYLALAEYATAAEVYGEIAPQLRNLRSGENRWINIEASRQALKVQQEIAQLEQRFADALAFAEIEQSILRKPDRDVLLRKAELLDRVAEIAAERARSADLDEEARHELRLEAESHWKEAAELYVRVAEEFDGRTQKAYPDDLWAAAQCFQKAGAHTEAIDILKRFLREQSTDGRAAQARLDLARQYEVLGRWTDAVETLEELVRLHDNSLPAFEGWYLMGEALIRKGPDFYEQAEDAFLELLEASTQVHPESTWYRRSLLEYARLLHRRGAYDQAVIRLNEYIQRYPDDPGALSARYLVASCVRSLALEARGQAADSVKLRDKQMYREVHDQKMASAVELLKELAEVYEQADTARMSPLRRQEYRNLLFDLGDSLFELGRTGEAVEVYDTIVYRFQSDPAVMDAYNQLARCYERLGRRDQTVAALERARWTLEKIPPAAFDGQLGGMSRAGWDNWIRAMQDQ